uniref:NADH-ubiquinone oxidoreductase chain 2 n=1 Tax=Lottia digitalis TaxID=225159 RepID=Q2I6Z1_9GAST|nr:NADH dehydrogenase subunit 2 [Lottia digitalis]ABC00936.1 NADH dehydrogenase subunit 2 [Lottia digitalis]
MSAPLLPSSIMFLAATLFSGLLAIGSSTWIFCFAGLIINTAAVIPNLIQLSLFGWKSGESAGKYFLVQAKASATYAMGCAVYWHWDVVGSSFYGTNHLHWGLALLNTSLLLKLGLFPFYAWVPGVTMGVSWFNCWLILTWQKYFPLVLLVQVFSSDQTPILHLVIMMTISFSALTGAILGMGQTNLRSLVAYSSLVHGSWSLMAAHLGILSVSLYMVVYSFTLSCVIFLFSRSGARSIQDPLLMAGGSEPISAGVTIVSLLSLAGTPPLLGFLGKWLVVSQWASNSLPSLPLAIALMASFISLNYYLSICWGFFWRTTSERSLMKGSLKKMPTASLLTINIFPLVHGIFMLGPFY